MLVLALACGGAPAPAPADAVATEKPAEKKGLNVVAAPLVGINGSKAVKIEVLLTGDPGLIGLVVDAGERWIDPASGGMVLDDEGKPIAKPDITQNVRSIALRNAEAAPTLEEKPDPNVDGNTLRKVRAYGTYRGCEFNGAGATMCYLDVAATAITAPAQPKGAWVVPSASLPTPDKAKKAPTPAPP